MKQMSKKLFACLLTLVLLAATAVLAIPVQADELVEGWLTYKVADEAAIITGCTEEAEGTLEIPAAINDMPVTAIAKKAFYGNKKITTVSIPATVASVGEDAFGSCMYLTAIRVDKNNATYCDEDGVLFSKDKKTLFRFPPRYTQGSYTIPDSVTTIGVRAFANCLLTAVEIPTTVTYIEGGAFHFSSGLTQVSLPDTITAIAFGVFSSCINLTSVIIPDTVTSIGKNAFSGCEKLEEIAIPNSVTSIGTSAFSGCVNLKKINIPDGVTAIAASTFYMCESLSTIHLPDSVTALGNRAFFFCDELKTVNLPDGITSIGREAFAGCYALEDVNLPESLAVIGDQAFHYCLSLDTAITPDNVTTIGYGAFAECSALTKVEISARVSAVPAATFRNCSKLELVKMPKSVVSVDCDAFSGCAALRRVQYGGSLSTRSKMDIEDGNEKMVSAEWVYDVQEDAAPAETSLEAAEEGMAPWLTTALYIVALLAAIGFLILLFRTKPSEY